MKSTDTDIPVLAVDFDGTLVESIWPKPGNGQAIAENVAKVHHAMSLGWEPVIHTSRPWYAYNEIAQALRDMGLPGLRIQCGKFLAAAYIDDRNIDINAAVWHP
jgi:hypothetical protein